MKIYEQRLKQLENNGKTNKEEENEALRARVMELEQIVEAAERTKKFVK